MVHGGPGGRGGSEDLSSVRDDAGGNGNCAGGRIVIDKISLKGIFFAEFIFSSVIAFFVVPEMLAETPTHLESVLYSAATGLFSASVHCLVMAPKRLYGHMTRPHNSSPAPK